MTEYTVIYEEADDGGWSAFVLELPGATTAADTQEEAEVQIRESIALYLDHYRQRGEPVPRNEVRMGRVTV